MISLVRIDNRLLHGQVLEAWTPHIRATRLVVVDDVAAASPLAQAAMMLCLPPELHGEVLKPGKVDYVALGAARELVLVLLREVSSLERAFSDGLTPAIAPKINLGNVHYAKGRRPVTPSVFLAEEEIRAIERLARSGFQIEARALPTDTPVSVMELAQKYDSEGEKR